MKLAKKAPGNSSASFATRGDDAWPIINSTSKRNLFLAHGDEAARGTEAEGGRFTQAVLRGLTAAQPNEAGQVTVDALRTWVNAVVSSGHQHPFFVQGHYGTRVLNHVGPQTPSGTGAERSGDPLGPATQNAIVDALVGAKLAPRAKRTLLFNGLPDAYQYGVPDGPDPISQLRNDVKYLAEAEPVDGQDEPPLALYLANACELARPGRKYRDALVDHRERVLRAPPTTESPDDTPATPAMTLIELRSALCAAYPTVDDVRRLCADAGLKVHRISLQGSVQNIWADALREADLVNQLEALRALARKEYPGRF